MNFAVSRITTLRITTLLFVPLFGVLISCVALELFFRVLPAVMPQTAKFDYARERPAFFYLPLTPQNLQGNEPQAEKKSDEYRIAVVGDSFSFAPGMQYSDAFPKKLEALLKTASNTTVLNLGTPGFSTVNELTTFAEALKAAPDLIVLQVTLNDPQMRPLQQESDDIRGSFGPYAPKSFLTRHSKFAAWMAARLHNTQSVSSYKRYHEYLWRDNWQRFAEPFEQMRAQAEAADVKFAVVLFPLFDFSLEQPDYPFAAIHKKIGSHVKNAKVPFLDLWPAYRGIDPYRLQLLPGRDTHPNEIAHRIAAEKIYLWLKELSFFPRERRLKRMYPRRANLREQQFPWLVSKRPIVAKAKRDL